MSTIAIITDTHFGARNENAVMFEWQRRFLHDVFFPTLDQHHITTVLHGGDYGDRRKFTNHYTIDFIENEYRQPMRARNITEHVIVGNHDCFLRDSTEINSISALFRLDDSVRVYAQPTEISVDGCDILMLPWICGNTRDATDALLRSTSCSVVLGHLELSGFQMYRGMPAHDGMDPQLFDRFDLVMSGHYHHRSTKDPITYLGAAWPMVWSDFRDPRGFHLFDTETRALTFVENPFSPFARLVYDDANQDKNYLEKMLHSIHAVDAPYRDAYVRVIVKSKTQPYWFDCVFDALTKVNTQDIVVMDDIVVESLEAEDDPIPSTDVDTMTLMQEYVEHLQISCDRQALQSYLRQLYHDAMSSTQSARLS